MDFLLRDYKSHLGMRFLQSILIAIPAVSALSASDLDDGNLPGIIRPGVNTLPDSDAPPTEEPPKDLPPKEVPAKELPREDDVKGDEVQVGDSRYRQKYKYDEICLSPKDFAKRRFAMDVVFTGISIKIPSPYTDYINTTFNLVKIENSNYLIPIIYSNKDKDLDDRFKNFEEQKLIRIFGILKYEQYRATGRKKFGADRIYYFEVEKIEKPDRSLVDDLKLLGETASQYDFLPVEFRRIDIQPYKYVGTKIRITIPFANVENRIPPLISKCGGLLPEDYFKINSVDLFNTAIIADRKNEKLVDELIKLKVGGMIDIFGVLKKVSDTSRKVILDEYFIYVVSAAPYIPPPPPPKK